MERFLKQIEQKLAHGYSRRSFFGKLGTAVTALAALTTGQIIQENNTAYASDKETKLRCCDGTVCPECKNCPTNTTPLYTWSCLDSHNNQNYICTDCFQEVKTKPYPVYQYVCTFASHTPSK